MAGAAKETLFKFVLTINGDMDPSLQRALSQTRKSFDEVDIGGMKLSKTFLEMGRSGHLTLGNLANGFNMIQQGAVTAGSAVASFGIGIVAALGSKAIHAAIDALKWGLKETVEIIKDGVSEAASLETVMMNVAKVTPGIRAEGGGYTALYGQYREDIRAMGIEYATLGYEGIGDIYAQGARGGIGKGMDDEERRLALQEYAGQTAMQAVAWEVDPQRTGMITRDWRTKLNMSPEEVNRVADLINYLENTNNADAGAMAEFVTQSGQLATGLNMPIDQVALMSTLWGVGGATGDPSKLSTDMNAILTRMATGGGRQNAIFARGAELIGYDDYNKLTREFGKNPFDTLVKVLEKINALENVDDRVRASYGLFGQGATGNIWTLLNNLDDVGPMLKEIASGAYHGSIAEEYGYLTDTYEYKKAQLEQIWDQFLVEAGTPFMEGLKEAWDAHGDEIMANIPIVAGKFAEMANVIFQPGGPMDTLISIIPAAVDLFADFLQQITGFLEHPLQTMVKWAGRLAGDPPTKEEATGKALSWTMAILGNENIHVGANRLRGPSDPRLNHYPEQNTHEFDDWVSGAVTATTPLQNIQQTNSPQFDVTVNVNGTMDGAHAQEAGREIADASYQRWTEHMDQYATDQRRTSWGQSILRVN